VTIEHASRTIPLINRTINRAVLEMDPEAEEPHERLLLDRVRHGHEWFKLDGHALELSYPVTEADYAEGRAEMAEGLREAIEEGIDEVVDGVEDGFLDGKARARAMGRLVSFCDLVASPVQVWHEDDLLRLRFGYRSMPSEIVARIAVGEYQSNLTERILETYGLHLDANLARYLLEPDAPAETEEEEAARLMAPRLNQRQRVRVLVYALQSGPSDELSAKLRQEPLPEGVGTVGANPSNDKLLALWREWLASRPVPRAGD
jgi:hypothetical protein